MLISGNSMGVYGDMETIYNHKIFVTRVKSFCLFLLDLVLFICIQSSNPKREDISNRPDKFGS